MQASRNLLRKSGQHSISLLFVGELGLYHACSICGIEFQNANCPEVPPEFAERPRRRVVTNEKLFFISWTPREEEMLS